MDKVETLKNENAQFLILFKKSFIELLALAKKKNELHFAFALSPEFRGMQDAGWNTAVESMRAFEEYIEFLDTIKNWKMRIRISLAFYCHIAESSGLYEVIKKMLNICSGKSNGVAPFADIVRENSQGSTITPNTNMVTKNLIIHANKLDLTDLADCLGNAFNSSIRNGYSHANYIVWNNGLRLPNRNGVGGSTIPWEIYELLLNRGINFFQIINQVIHSELLKYESKQVIECSLHDEPARKHQIHFNPESGEFKIESL